MGAILLVVIVIGLLAYIISGVFPIIAWSLLAIVVIFLCISAINRLRVKKREADAGRNQSYIQEGKNTLKPIPSQSHAEAKDMTEIALQLFDSQGLGGVIGPEAQRIINSCNNRQEVLLKAIELCGDDPSTPKELYIVSNCYVWLGAKYRPQAIEYLEKYIAAGAAYGSTKENAKYRKSAVYKDLGEAYEGEYEFDKAEQAYLTAEKICPDTASYTIATSRIYTKKGDLQRALDHLEAKKTTSYYINNTDSYKTIIDSFIDETKEKISKGYVYSPRKKKQN